MMPMEDLGGVGRALRAAYRDEAELLEEASEQLARKEADLVDLVLEAMQRGQPVRVRVGSSQFAGTLVHVADDVAILEDSGGAQVDIRLTSVSELVILDPMPGLGQGRRRDVPACFEDCLEGLEATGSRVELGGPDLPPRPCRVVVAASDHLVLGDGGVTRVVPRAGVGFVVRRR